MKNHLSVLILLFSLNTAFSQSEIEISQSFVDFLFVKNDYKNAQLLFDENLKAQVSEDVLKSTVNTLKSQLGEFINVIEYNQELIEPNQIVYAYSKFSVGNFDIKLVFNDIKKIQGFFVVPHKTFNKLDSNIQLNIPNRDILIKGQLNIPQSENRKILAIFIHGSGPQDRDATIYDNKPFKNIAEGLSLKGITSYRFDKRTLSYSNLFVNQNYTIDDEICDDIYTIVDYFKKSSPYSNYKIVLIGHSLGGMLIPKLVDSLKNNINGLIMISANALPLQDLIEGQMNYLYTLNPSTELKSQIEILKPQLKYLNSKQFDQNSPRELLPLSLPASYWLSLMEYNQLKSATLITLPTLIVQGERDYQVTPENYNLWKKSLKNNSNFSFKIYPLLNHILTEGEGKPNPKEYQQPKSVPDYFIQDLSDWISKNCM